MKNENRSLTLSLILTKLLLGGLVATAIVAPYICRIYENTMNIRNEPSVFVPMLIAVYLGLVAVFPAVFALHKLLSNIKGKSVFVRQNVQILRLISYCSFGVGIVFAGFGVYRSIAFAIAVAALFFGLIMRVLKNVFAAAVTLKEESDLTI